MSTTLHVGNIPSAVLEDDLRATFARIGPVDTVKISRNPVSGTSNGFATVAMTRNEDAVTAISRLNLTQYAGRTIAVSRSR